VLQTADKQMIGLAAACVLGIGIGALVVSALFSQVEPSAAAGGALPPIEQPLEPPAPQPPDIGTHVVEAVVSGDTLTLEGVGNVRLLGVDTASGPDGKPIDPVVSKALLSELVAGKNVTAICDPATADTSFKDPNGAYLVYLMLDDGVIVNTELVGRGGAVADLSRGYDRKDELVRAERDARWAGRGVWQPQTARLEPMAPSDLGRYTPPPGGRIPPPGAIGGEPQKPSADDVLVTKDGRFHRQSCRLAKGGVPMAIGDARAKHYLACPVCFVSPRVKA
jgi:micrococcal nuclease